MIVENKIIENSASAFEKLIAGLSDRPELSPADLKAYFDGNALQIAEKLNRTIDNLLAVGSGDSGADNIGASAVGDGNGETVQAVLEEMYAKIVSEIGDRANADGVLQDEIDEILNGGAFNGLLDSKVDKVDGKALSQNDFTDGKDSALAAAVQDIDGIKNGSVVAYNAVNYSAGGDIEAVANKIYASNVVGSPVIISTNYLTGVTYDSATKVFTKVGHGLIAGTPVELNFDAGGALPSGYNVFNAPVFPIVHGKFIGWLYDVTADTFQIVPAYGSATPIVTTTNGSNLKIRQAGVSQVALTGLNGNIDGGEYIFECMGVLARKTTAATFINFTVNNITASKYFQKSTNTGSSSVLNYYSIYPTIVPQSFIDFTLDAKFKQFTGAQIKINTEYQWGYTGDFVSWTVLTATQSGVKRGQVVDSVNATNMNSIELNLGDHFVLNDSKIILSRVK